MQMCLMPDIIYWTRQYLASCLKSALSIESLIDLWIEN